MAVRSDDGLADRVRCGKYEYKCREPKTGQQKIQLYYDEDPLCPSSYITVPYYLCFKLSTYMVNHSLQKHVSCFICLAKITII